MNTISIDETKCVRCGKCSEVCGIDIITTGMDKKPVINDVSQCFNCGHCVAVCPKHAIAHSNSAQQTEIKSPLINSDEMESLLASRRSCREYTSEIPKKEDITTMLRSATMAPTAHNCEERAFIVLSNKEVIEQLRTSLIKRTKKLLILDLFTKKPFSWFFSTETVDYFTRMILDLKKTLEHSENGHDMIFNNAPVIVLFTSHAASPFGKDHALHAMNYFMAQAQAMGYGTCINGFSQGAPKLVAKYVKIKKDYRVFGVITLGKPKLTYKRTVTRRDPLVIWVMDTNFEKEKETI